MAQSPSITPRPSFGVLLCPGVVPCAIHVNGLRMPLAAGTPLTARYEWDFGDPAGKYNQLRGFNAAHIYDRPGKYTIRLTLTDETGVAQSAAASVVIVPDFRRRIYVSPEGLDANTGLSPDAPLRTPARAFKIAKNGTDILLAAGAKFDMTTSLSIDASDVLIDRYGDGPDPILNRLTGNGTSAISIDGRCDGITIQHLTFDSPYAADPSGEAPKIGVVGIFVHGKNIAVRDCTFLNVDDAVNANGNPRGLLVQNCRDPLPAGLRGYLIWGQGSDQVYLGNFAANSTREHILRMTAIQRVLAAYNNFTNLDRRPADRYDYSKGCIECHNGSYFYICNNTVADGTIRVGPLGGANEPPTTATDWSVIDGNTLTNTYVFAQVGSHHVMIRNNEIHRDNGQAIVIAGPDQFGRISGDISILNNTAINNSPVGAFLKLWGRTDGIVMANNLFVAGHLNVGVNGAADVNIAQNDLSSFTQIAHNIWPPGAGDSAAVDMIANQPITADQWSAYPQVKGDLFAAVKLDASAVPVSSSPADGYALEIPGVFCDHDGAPVDRRTVGAKQIGRSPATTQSVEIPSH